MSEQGGSTLLDPLTNQFSLSRGTNEKEPDDALKDKHRKGANQGSRCSRGG